jgi:hypothetical protein
MTNEEQWAFDLGMNINYSDLSNLDISSISPKRGKK